MSPYRIFPLRTSPIHPFHLGLNLRPTRLRTFTLTTTVAERKSQCARISLHHKTATAPSRARIKLPTILSIRKIASRPTTKHALHQLRIVHLVLFVRTAEHHALRSETEHIIGRIRRIGHIADASVARTHLRRTPRMQTGLGGTRAKGAPLQTARAHGSHTSLCR